jgi:beta-galactosidase
VATYQKGDYAGKPAVTANAYGSGPAVYVGTLGDEDFYGPLLDWLLPLISVQPLMQVPPGVEVTERWQGDEPVRFVLNHTPQSQSVTFDQPFLNLLNGEQVKGQVSLAPFDVLVLARELPGAS